MTGEKSRWGFSASERRALLFIIAAFLLGLGYRLYQKSRTLETLPISVQESSAVAAIKFAYYDTVETKLGRQADNRGGATLVQNPPDSVEVDLLLDVNRASWEDLDLLPGIGPVLAKRIILERDARNGFKHVEEILEVPGIGPNRFKKIRPLICCNPLN